MCSVRSRLHETKYNESLTLLGDMFVLVLILATVLFKMLGFSVLLVIVRTFQYYVSDTNNHNKNSKYSPLKPPVLALYPCISKLLGFWTFDQKLQVYQMIELFTLVSFYITAAAIRIQFQECDIMLSITVQFHFQFSY